jgi:penicillin-binding protein 1C
VSTAPKCQIKLVPDRPQSRRRSWRWGWLLLAPVIWLIGYFLAPLFVPLPVGLTDPAAFAPGVAFTDREGRPLRRLLADGELRIDRPVELDEIPRSLIDATLAAEDRRFYSHGGIDFFGLTRAVRDALRHRTIVSGASTVTQQLVKISSPPRARDLNAKVTEMFTARKLEMVWSKEEILAAYLNRLPYGNQLTGCGAAARGYFGKPLGDLSLAESAFLAALPNKPTRFNPYKNLDGAQERQRWILARMLIQGWIDDDAFQSAMAEPLRLVEGGPAGEFEAPHLIELIVDVPQTGKVTTTIDLPFQRFVESTVDTQLAALDAQIGRQLTTQAAVVVIENATGDVLALAGSRGFLDSPGGQINGAWTPRSPGSTLKPFTYLLSLDRGGSPGAIFPDVPVEYPTPTGAYRPVNYDRRFRGPVTMRFALANSLNIPAIRALDGAGGPAKLHEALTNKLGFTGLNPDAATYGLGLTLGTAEVRLLELTNAYACLARLGVARPYSLTREFPIKQGMIGDTTGYDQNRETRVFDSGACWVIADMLSDNLARAAAFGLNSPLRFPFRVAAKTGTSTDYRDNWTLGFTPTHTVGVWVGHFGNQSLQNVSGVSGAGPIFHAVMMELYRDGSPDWFPKPEGWIEAEIDPMTGRRATAEFRPAHSVHEWFRMDDLPEPARPADYDDGRPLLARKEYAAWLDKEGREFADRIALADVVETAEPVLRILSPLPGTMAYLDADLPGGGEKFPLRAESDGGEIEWSSETLAVEADAVSKRAWLILKPGRHRVTATDLKTGARSVSEIEVTRL